MLPTVAPLPQFQPHHHLDHHYQRAYDALNGAYDLSETASLFRHDSLKSAYQSISRTRFQLPHPVQRTDSLDGSTNDPHATNTGEHALRRKTPNGTLAAGYDGTPGDRAIQPPATKHILVSSLDPGHLLPPHSNLSLDNWLQLASEQRTSSAHLQSFPPVFGKTQDLGRPGSNGLPPDQLFGNGTSWVRSVSNYPPPIDSVLSQTLRMQQPSQRYYLHPPSVPTVLPAALQPCLGPTAPVGTGPYGPYWPDGAYIPYRPAALRDSRFYPPSPLVTDHRLDPSLYNAGPHQPLGRSGVPPSGLPAVGLSWEQGPSGALDPEAVLQQKLQLQHAHLKYPLGVFSDPNALPYHARTSNVNANLLPHPSSGEASGWSEPQTNRGHQPSPPLSGAGSRTQNGEFKEKALSWAHGVYVDLLASLHYAQRNGSSKTGADGRSSKPSIFPKPPRQPGVDFSNQPNPGDLQRHHSYPSTRLDAQSQAPSGHPDSISSASGLPGNRPPSDRAGRGLVLAYRPSSDQAWNGFRPPRKASASVLSRLSAGQQNENQTLAVAASALEMLSTLCMESGWEWIDGILLGGCLAYGLGDYNKAMRWYSRIIVRDST